MELSSRCVLTRACLLSCFHQPLTLVSLWAVPGRDQYLLLGISERSTCVTVYFSTFCSSPTLLFIHTSISSTALWCKYYIFLYLGFVSQVWKLDYIGQLWWGFHIFVFLSLLVPCLPFKFQQSQRSQVSITTTVQMPRVLQVLDPLSPDLLSPPRTHLLF